MIQSAFFVVWRMLVGGGPHQMSLTMDMFLLCILAFVIGLVLLTTVGLFNLLVGALILFLLWLILTLDSVYALVVGAVFIGLLCMRIVQSYKGKRGERLR
jgi:hypothetical protein